MADRHGCRVQVEKMPQDDEFNALLHNIHSQNIPGHLYRGFTLLGSNPPVREISVRLTHHQVTPVDFPFQSKVQIFACSSFPNKQK